MVLSRAPSSHLVLVERDPDLARLCERNLELNRFNGRVAEADILDPDSRRTAGLMPGSADLVVTNPPFLDEGRVRVSPDVGRATAHTLPEGGLEAWLSACRGLLKAKGRLVLIHRADRVADCLAALGKDFGGVRLRLVHPQGDRPAIRLIVAATKGSRAPLTVEAPLILHDEEGRFTPQADALHRGSLVL
jgi:tRNA1(Val) A37 N6-methylase TrmN6